MKTALTENRHEKLLKQFPLARACSHRAEAAVLMRGGSSKESRVGMVMPGSVAGESTDGSPVRNPGPCGWPPQQAGKPALRGGFSLVEVLVAMTLLAVIIVALMVAFRQTQRAFRAGVSQSDFLESGRAIMAIISRDVQEMTLAGVTNGYNFYANLAPNCTPITNLAEIDCLMLEDLYCLTRRNDEWISYKYAFDEVQISSGVATLYRKRNTASFTNLDNVCHLSDARQQTGMGANFIPDFHRIADGIVHFRLEAPARASTNLVVTNFFGIETNLIPNTPYLSYAYSYTNLPEYVDLELGILEPATLKALEAKLSIVPANDVPAATRDFLSSRAGKIHLFRQRIPIRTQGRLDI